MTRRHSRVLDTASIEYVERRAVRVWSVSPMSIQPLRRGFVLHRRDYRNSSLLIDLFTADEGRLVCVAKGAKASPRGRSALASLLQPFQPLWLNWFGRGEVKTLGRAEAAGPSIALSGDRLYCGFYLNELLLRLTERHDAQESLFVFYQQALADLEAEPIDAVLRRFELRLLEELGYALDLSSDRDEAPVSADRCYRYQASLGLERMADAEPKRPTRIGESAGEAVAAQGRAGRDRPTQPTADPAAELGAGPGVGFGSELGAEPGPEPGPEPAPELGPGPGVLITGDTLQRLVSGAALESSDLAPARALMRAALAPHLGPKPLRSRELFRRRSH